MGQFNWFWPVWSESQKQQREDAKNSNFWRRILKKCTAEIPCATKKSKQSFCSDETGRQKKKLRKRKVLRALHLSVAVDKNKNLHGALTGHACSAVTKNNFCAPCRPHTSARKWQKNIFLAARATQLLQKRPVTKKITARQTATGHWKKLRALHRSVAVTKRPDTPALLRPKKKFLARGQTKLCRSDRTQQKKAARTDVGVWLWPVREKK
jgi:hypothetical protein